MGRKAEARAPAGTPLPPKRSSSPAEDLLEDMQDEKEQERVDRDARVEQRYKERRRLQRQHHRTAEEVANAIAEDVERGPPESRATYKDVLLALVGEDPVAELEEMRPGYYALKRAWSIARAKRSASFDKLLEYLQRRGMSFTGARVRLGPKPGDVREYSVQHPPSQKGDPFIRLVVGTLLLRRGDRVRVRYMRGQIRITRAPRTGEDDRAEEE